MTYQIVKRAKFLHLNDPRCYDGAYYDAEYLWGEWRNLEDCASLEKAQSRIKFWAELNDYAVSQRGDSAKAEFKIEEKAQ